MDRHWVMEIGTLVAIGTLVVCVWCVARMDRTAKPTMTDEHRKKFTWLLTRIEQAKIEQSTVVVHDPAVLGDDYPEITTNLNLLAAAGLTLRIVPPGKRAR